MGFVSSGYCLPVEVYEGAGGDLIIMQEFPGIEGESYVRVFIGMEDAERICSEIMRVAGAARPK